MDSQDLPHGVKVEDGFVRIPNDHPQFHRVPGQAQAPYPGGVTIKVEELTNAQRVSLGLEALPVEEQPANKPAGVAEEQPKVEQPAA